jgi:TonB family protein
MKKLSFACLLLILGFVGLAFTQEKTSEKLYEFKGIVKDTNEAVIAGTSLNFNGNNKKFAVISNADGEFTTQLLVGTYEITINKDISSSFIAFIEIRENAINPNNIEFVIKTNPLCCGQSPDKMFPKLVKFIVPSYPAAARAVRATGEVIVAVKIDKEGKVISAIAEGGHSLLRKAAEQAATVSLFVTSENTDEREAKLTYVFLSESEKQNLKHYSNPYRLEVISQPLTIDY